MSVDDNRQITLRYLRLCHERNEPVIAELCTSDCTWWSPGVPAMGLDDFRAMLAQVAQIMPVIPKLHVVGTTAEGDRVAVEVQGEGTLANGRAYQNTYHFLFVLRDGLICEVKEYNDTKYAAAAMGIGA